MNDKNTTLLMVEHLRKIYSCRFGGSQVEALKDVSLGVERDEFIAVMGESGSGKTTLLNLLAVLDRPTEGKILLDGKDITQIRDSNIYLPLVLSNTPKEQMESRIEPLAAQLKISDILEKYPYEVSGGQKQRAAIARALITAPKIVLADEPTGALDSHSSAQVMKLFTDIHRTGQTILVVTHSVKTACYAGRVLFIRDGRLFNQLYRGDMDNEAFQEKISDNLKILLQKEGLDA